MHPTDEQVLRVDIFFLATKMICSLSTLNCIYFFFHWETAHLKQLMPGVVWGREKIPSVLQ